MAEIIRMPRLSDTMEEGVIVEWLKKEGESVEPGDILAEVETDKATMELENYHEGILLHIGVKEGPVPVNGILAVIGDKGEDFQEALSNAQSADAQNGSTDQAPDEATSNVSTPTVSESLTATSSAAEATGISGSTHKDERIKASPLARKMAQERGINLHGVQGSGENGRIIKQDIVNYKQSPASTAIPAVALPSELETKEVAVSQMRKVIARRLSESKFAAPHFYVTMEIDMAESIRARKKLNETAPPKISFNDIVVKACAMAIRQHPAINSSWLGDSIRQNGDINIGVAVAVPEGLLVPVVRQADLKSLSHINHEVRELAGLARDRRLQPDQMQGNTFTISNLGMFDVEEFTAIINPPDSCILAVGGIMEKPVVRDGQIVIGNIMKVTLSSDHRVVDGATAAQFLRTLKMLLENPMRMLL